MDGPETIIRAIVADMPGWLERNRKLADLNDRWRVAASKYDRWNILRETYALIMPIITRRRTAPYFLDWSYHLTPIERLAWADIRSIGLPLYPQLPALQYFLDFADPILKIAVELDGKAYHDPARDLVRDTNLWGNGWRVFRIPGKRSLASKTDLASILNETRNDIEAIEAITDWGTMWSEGFFWALGHYYYRKPNWTAISPDVAEEAARQILYAHQIVQFPLKDGEDE